jgi:hypothetical protein
MARLETSLRRKERLKRDIVDLFSRCRSFHWPQDKFLQGRDAIYSSDDWVRAPQWVKSWLQGYMTALMENMERHEHAFSYEIDGKRMLLTDPEYKAMSPREVHEKWSHTGALVWKDDRNRIWFQSKKE